MQSKINDFSHQIDLKREFNRIHEKLNMLIEKQLKEKEPQTWIKVGLVQKLTGWDKHMLYRARRSNIIKFKKGENGMVYLLESIPEQLIKKQE
jgi:hypothetical protein